MCTSAVSIRLKSVKNIEKITKSMKMVSAAKFQLAERELKPARTYGEGAQGTPYISLNCPRPEKGLVHTDCAYISLYPESGYTAYSLTIPSKLSGFGYVIVLKLASITINTQ